MKKYNFWESWERKNKVEKTAIEAVEKARTLIIKAIPKDKLFAIYIKGSFTRREMKEGSDIDIVPIVTENRWQGKIFAVNSAEVYPCMVIPLSLWELKHNRLFTKSSYSCDLRAKPDRLLKKINECKLIYGKSLRSKKFSVSNDKKALKDEILVLKKGYIPYYEKGKISFDPLLKEVFWLTELEQNIKEKKVKHSFKGITASVKDKTHIIHDAFRFRKGSLKSKKEKRTFISKLKKHLKNLEK